MRVREGVEGAGAEGDADRATIRILPADVHANACRPARVVVTGDRARVRFGLGEGGSFEKRALALSARLADWRSKRKDRSRNGPRHGLPEVSLRRARN